MTFQTSVSLSVFSLSLSPLCQALRLPPSLDDCFALLSGRGARLPAGHFVGFLGGMDFCRRGRRWLFLFPLHFFSPSSGVERHLSVNNSCSSSEGHCWRGAEVVDLLGRVCVWRGSDPCVRSNMRRAQQKVKPTSDGLSSVEGWRTLEGMNP